MRAITYSRYGGPDVLELTDLPDPQGRPRQRPRARPCGVGQPGRLEGPRGLPRPDHGRHVPRGPGLGRRRRGRACRPGHPGAERRRRGLRLRPARLGAGRHVRRVRRGAGPHARAQAREPDLRGGGGRPAGRAHRAPGHPPSRRARPGRPSSCTPRPAASARSRCRSPGRSAPASSAPRPSATTSTCAAWAPSPVEYGDGLVERVRALAPDGVDVVLDFGGDDLVETSKALLADGGTVASIVDAAARDELGGHYVWVRPSTEDLDALTALHRGRHGDRRRRRGVRARRRRRRARGQPDRSRPRQGRRPRRLTCCSVRNGPRPPRTRAVLLGKRVIVEIYSISNIRSRTSRRSHGSAQPQQPAGPRRARAPVGAPDAPVRDVDDPARAAQGRVGEAQLRLAVLGGRLAGEARPHRGGVDRARRQPPARARSTGSPTPARRRPSTGSPTWSARPVKEFPQFEAALSFLPLLGPDDVVRLLRLRLASLERQVAGLEATLADARGHGPARRSSRSRASTSSRSSAPSSPSSPRWRRASRTGRSRASPLWRDLHARAAEHGRLDPDDLAEVLGPYLSAP